MSNNWVNHVKLYRQQHPSVTYKQALVEARTSYYQQKGGSLSPEDIDTLVCSHGFGNTELCNSLCTKEGDPVFNLAENHKAKKIVDQHKLSLSDRKQICKKCNKKC